MVDLKTKLCSLRREAYKANSYLKNIHTEIFDWLIELTDGLEGNSFENEIIDYINATDEYYETINSGITSKGLTLRKTQENLADAERTLILKYNLLRGSGPDAPSITDVLHHIGYEEYDTEGDAFITRHPYEDYQIMSLPEDFEWDDDDDDKYAYKWDNDELNFQIKRALRRIER